MMTPIRANNKASLGSMFTSSDTTTVAAAKQRDELIPSKKQANGKSWANAVTICCRGFHIFVISNAGILNR
jgi:hypothetical protein